MPQVSRLLAAAAAALLPVFALAFAPAPQSGPPFRVVVRVVDEETGQWVEGAQVQLRDVTPTHQTARELFDAGLTDSFGRAETSVGTEGSFRIEVAKPGYTYKDGQRDGQPHEALRVIELARGKWKERIILVPLVKDRGDDKFTASVRVVDGANREGVAGARVFVRNSLAHSESYEAATDANGLVTFVIPKKGIGANYTVSVSGKGYKDALANFDTPRRGEPDVKLPVTLERDADFHRARLVVRVTREGSSSAVSGARVNVYPAGNESATHVASGGTDETGRAVLELRESGDYRVVATHPSYTNYCNQKSVQLAKYATGDTEVFIRLIHPDNVPQGERPGCADLGEAEWTNRTIRVEVFDAETGERVPQADVRLLVADGRRYADRSTLGGEMVTIEVGATDKAPAELLRKGFTLEVSKSQYNAHTEPITYERLAGLPSLGLTVRLTKTDEGKEAEEEAKAEKRLLDIRTEMAALRGRVDLFLARLNDLRATNKKVREEAGRVKEIADKSFEGLRGMRWEEEKMAGTFEGCRDIAAARAQIGAAAEQAEKAEEAVRKQLDYAERLASDCKDEYSVEAIKNNYAKAREELLKVTRALTSARERNEEIKSLWGLKNSLPERMSRLEQMVAWFNEREEAARTPATVAALHGQSLRGLQETLARDDVRAEVAARAAEWKRLPEAQSLSGEIDALVALSVQARVDPAEFDYEDSMRAAQDQVSRFAGMKAEASEILARANAACPDRVHFDADDDVARIERVWLSLGVEVGAAETGGLGKKIDECLAKLKKVEYQCDGCGDASGRDKKLPDDEGPPEPAEEAPEPAEEATESEPTAPSSPENKQPEQGQGGGEQVGDEIRYGPFSATGQSWRATGVRLQKGQSFRWEASGELSANNDGQVITSGPGGVGNWGWRVLRGKIGDSTAELGGKGQMAAWADGVLELGVPRVDKFSEEYGDSHLRGAFTVYIYVKRQ